MDGVKRLFGMLLLATAWWMLIPVVPTWVQMTGWAFLAIVAAVMLRAFDALPAGAGAGRMFGKGLGLLLALAAAAWLVGAASGGRDVLQPLGHLAAGGAAATPGAASAGEAHFKRVRTIAELDAALAQSRQPVMLDFYADWCVSCREMERFTFTDPGVAQRMGQMLLLQADVTANNADDRALLKRFRLFGPPGIMFFEPDARVWRMRASLNRWIALNAACRKLAHAAASDHHAARAAPVMRGPCAFRIAASRARPRSASPARPTPHRRSA